MTLIRRLILTAVLSSAIAPAFSQTPPPVPALPDTERRTSYSISGSTCACAVGFQLYGDSTDYANWLEVFVNGVLLTQPGNWTISSPTGPLSTIPRPITDAVLTFTTAQTGTVQIVGARRPRRTSQFQESQPVPTRNFNQTFSDITATLRELWDKTNDVTGRSVRAPPGETLALLPSQGARASMGACFDSGGNLTACVSIPSSTFIAGTGINFTGSNPTSINANPLNLTAGPGIAIVANAVQLANAQTPVRQAILSGAVDTTGFPGFANPGGGLNVNLTATASPLTMTFAAGFNALTGAVDYVGQLAADATSYWSSLPANQYSFLAVDRNASTGALTPTQTLMRPQRGPVFYAPRQALMHFENNLVDDWGNAWASNGATFSNTITKFGTYSLRLSGSTSYAQSASILNPGQGNWTISTWVNLDSNVNSPIFALTNSYGVLVATNASGKLSLYLSSAGPTSPVGGWDISTASPGLTTVTSATWHHVELSFDGSAYRLFLDGTIQVTITNSTIVWQEGAALAVGSQPGVSNYAAGYWDEFEMVPYARHVAAFTPPVAAYSISGDWFDTNAMVMKTASGAGPIWTPIQRQYVAEAVTGVSTVTAVYNYSSVSQFRGVDFAVNPGASKVKVGKSVFFAGTPQFATAEQIIGYYKNYVLSPALVPPDATYFYVQTYIFHAPISSANYTDCSVSTRLPVGISQNYGYLGTAFGLYSGMGTANPALAFTEPAGNVLRFPVLNGIAVFGASIGGPTCIQAGNNANFWGILIGYDMP